MINNINRRKFPRANYPCQLTLWKENGQGDTILANTSNIGVGGIGVYLDQSLLVGTKLNIQIYFTAPSIPLKCQGTVVRCEKDSASTFFAVGIQFDSLGELKHAFLEGKVSELMALENKDEKHG